MTGCIKQGNRVPGAGAKRSVALRPAAQLNSKSDSQLGELKHVGEAEFIRDVQTTVETQLARRHSEQVMTNSLEE